MKRRIVIGAVCLAILAAAIGLLADFHRYRTGSRELNEAQTGIVFTLSTFNGESESGLFVPCLGHAWASVENRTDRPICIKDNEIKPGEAMSFAAWATTGHAGVVFNLEPTFIRDHGRYRGFMSVSTQITEEQVARITRYIEAHNTWNFVRNCSYWALCLWNEIVPEAPIPRQTLLYTPSRLQKGMCEFTCAETDHVYPDVGQVFLYENGVRTELVLCSD